jgi:hypothetical protein
VSRDPRLYLEDIRQGCEKVLRYTEGITFDQFLEDERTLDAVVRNLEIIGEAVRHIPGEIKQRYPRWSGLKSWRCGTLLLTNISEWMKRLFGTLSRCGSRCCYNRCSRFS